MKVSKDQVIEVLDKVFKSYPSFTYNVVESKTFDGLPMLKIFAHYGNIEINQVRGQYVQLVSLALWPWGLAPQVFGGNGGQHIYRKPDLSDPKEKYLAMKGIKIPFRSPKNEEKAILKAIENFFTRYVDTMKENKGNLMYQNLVGYVF